MVGCILGRGGSAGARAHGVGRSAALAVAFLALAATGACGSEETGTTPGGGETGAGGQGGAATGGGGSGGGTSTGGGAPLTSASYTATDELFPNPERGLRRWSDLLETTDYGYAVDEGRTLVHSYVLLADYVDAPLDQALLDALSAGFQRVRDAGLKVVLRIAYNHGENYPNSIDASKSQVLEHIATLTPLLEANADVIVIVEAGFIGAWGEWHHSSNGLDNETDRRDILLALLDALPPERMVEVRTPFYKVQAFQTEAPLTEAEAYDTSLPRARVAHHNDCFLVSDDDAGTYTSQGGTPDWDVEQWKTYLAEDSRFVPVGGETCGLNPPRTDCPTALEEFERFHWFENHLDYHPDVVAGWEAQGCLPEIDRRLGYRFELSQASWSSAVAPGGVLALEIELRNVGYAALFNPRPLAVVVGTGANRRFAALGSVDPRRWAPGATAMFATHLRIPASLAPGNVRLALWLPDGSASIRDRVEYAIRFANDGVWDAVAGENVLTEELLIDPSAPGPVDPNATELVELP